MTVRRDSDERLLDEAVAWQVAQACDDVDWEGYRMWLEADPRHREAVDEIALVERIVDDRADDLRRFRYVAPKAVPFRSEPSQAATRGRVMFGAVATAVALAVGVPVFWPRADTIYATGATGYRKVALGNGVEVELAPATRLLAKGGDPSRLELATGDAYFVVAHDTDRPLSIEAGEYALTDIGTTFGVTLSPAALSVSVAKGTVSVVPKAGDPTRVGAGHKLVAIGQAGTLEVGPVAASDVGSWRQGRLVYERTPLGVVVTDISRHSGKTVTVDPTIRDRRFSGVLVIGKADRMAAELAELAGLSRTFDGAGGGIRLGDAGAR